MSKRVAPLDDRVFIMVGSPTETDTSGIVIPESAKEDYPAEGTIIDFGAKVDDLRKGDRCLFSKYAGDDVTVQGIPYKIVPRENVIALLINE